MVEFNSGIQKPVQFFKSCKSSEFQWDLPLKVLEISEGYSIFSWNSKGPTNGCWYSSIRGVRFFHVRLRTTMSHPWWDPCFTGKTSQKSSPWKRCYKTSSQSEKHTGYQRILQLEKNYYFHIIPILTKKSPQRDSVVENVLQTKTSQGPNKQGKVKVGI